MSQKQKDYKCGPFSDTVSSSSVHSDRWDSIGQYLFYTNAVEIIMK